jgi:riboflavin biosynthesis pyrimidine reductase
MPVIATLVVGADGSTSKDGNSAGVTTALDRSEFLQRRRSADCIIIGGNTARTEPYQRTPVPVVVLSRALINPLSGNRLAHCWNLSPTKAVDKALETFGPRIHIEAGATILDELVRAGRIDELELSITAVKDGEDKMDIEELLTHFTIIKDQSVEGTRFISAKKR